jgi:chromosome segregation ATPase
MQGDISGLKTDVSGLKQGQAKLESTVSKMDKRLSNLETGQKEIRKDIRKLHEYSSGAFDEINRLYSMTDELQRKVK